VAGVIDFTQHFLVRKLLEGFHRSKPTTDTRLPISLPLLAKIVNILPTVCRDTYETKLFAAAYTLAFFGFLRVGEITACSLTNSGHSLHKKDVRIDDKTQSIHLNIRHSKTDQCGKGTNVIIPQNKGDISVLQKTRQYLAVRPPIEGAFFCHFGGKPLTRYQFTAVLKKALEKLGLNGLNFKTHSFRIGAATMAALNGLSEEEIQVAGRWKSLAFKSYIRIPQIGT